MNNQRNNNSNNNPNNNPNNYPNSYPNYPNNYPNSYSNNYPNNYPNNQQTPYRNQSVPVKKQSTGKLAAMIVGIVMIGSILLVVGVVIFFRYIYSGKNSSRNKEWVQKMNDTFPDDEFTYVSYDKIGVTGLGSFRNKNVIVVSSKNLPKRKVTVGWDDNHTQLVTDYNYRVYEDDLDEYYKEVIGRFFTPDDMKVSYMIYFDYKTELKPYTFDEFRESHSDVYNLTAHMKYSGAFPSEEEVTKALESIIYSLDDTVNLTIYMSHDSLDYGDNTEGNERYILSMESPTRIKYLDHYTINWITTKTGKDIRRDIEENIYENKDVD